MAPGGRPDMRAVWEKGATNGTQDRHQRMLTQAKERIFQSPVSPYIRELYLYGSMARGEETWESDVDLFLVLDEPETGVDRELKREILYLKGSISGDDIRDPEVDLKVVFGDAWKTSSQIYYDNVRREGIKLWEKN